MNDFAWKRWSSFGSSWHSVPFVFFSSSTSWLVFLFIWFSVVLLCAIISVQVPNSSFIASWKWQMIFMCSHFLDVLLLFFGNTHTRCHGNSIFLFFSRLFFGSLERPLTLPLQYVTPLLVHICRDLISRAAEQRLIFLLLMSCQSDYHYDIRFLNISFFALYFFFSSL